MSSWTRRVQIEVPEDLGMLDEVEKGPVVFEVKRDLYDVVDFYLKKKMVITSFEGATQDYISIKAVHPRHLCRLSRNVAAGSARLAEGLAYRLLGSSRFRERRYLGSPIQLASFISRTCRVGYNLLFILSLRLPVKAFIVCGGIEGAILGALYESWSALELGETAVYKALHSAPADVLVYDVPESELEPGIFTPAGGTV